MGDYKVDTIVGAARSQHILTLNDRKTGKVWLSMLENPTAAEAADQIIGILECLKQYVIFYVFWREKAFVKEDGGDIATIFLEFQGFLSFFAKK